MKNDIAEIRELIQAADDEHNPKKFIEKLGEFSAHAILMLPALLDELEALRKSNRVLLELKKEAMDALTQIASLGMRCPDLDTEYRYLLTGDPLTPAQKVLKKWSTPDE